MDGSSAREPGISAAGQESESKLRFGGRDCGRNLQSCTLYKIMQKSRN